MKPPTLKTLAIVALGLLPLAGAQADGERERRMPAAVPAAYRAECGACHTAYPPALLPAKSWHRLMGGLDTHFGSDASLDPATVRQLDGWLQAHAARGSRTAEPPEERITRTAWFERKHRHIEPAVWALPSVKSAAQCAACHGDAEQGRFDDDALRQPAGLTPAQRRAWFD